MWKVYNSYLTSCQKPLQRVHIIISKEQWFCTVKISTGVIFHQFCHLICTMKVYSEKFYPVPVKCLHVGAHVVQSVVAYGRCNGTFSVDVTYSSPIIQHCCMPWFSHRMPHLRSTLLWVQELWIYKVCPFAQKWTRGATVILPNTFSVGNSLVIPNTFSVVNWENSLVCTSATQACVIKLDLTQCILCENLMMLIN